MRRHDSITAHLRMHRDSLKTFLRVQRAFAENPEAAFTVLNNTGHATEAFPADISYLKGLNTIRKRYSKASRRVWTMPIAKEKSPKTSMRRHAVTRKASQVNAKRLPARSAAQLAEQSCEEMIQNLKRNVAEHTARSGF